MLRVFLCVPSIMPPEFTPEPQSFPSDGIAVRGVVDCYVSDTLLGSLVRHTCTRDQVAEFVRLVMGWLRGMCHARFGIAEAILMSAMSRTTDDNGHGRAVALPREKVNINVGPGSADRRGVRTIFLRVADTYHVCTVINRLTSHH